jgi:hypothetical protein
MMPRRSALIAAMGGAMVALAGASPVRGSDGVIEISQSQIAAGSGFPYTITQPGSYLLTSNLVVSDENTTAIQIYASDVTVDLNGFAIKGPTVCTGGGGNGTSCAPTGIGRGIYSSGSYESVTVRNGIVRGMGSNGVRVSSGRSRVENLIVISNGGAGVHTGWSATVWSCVISLNRTWGLGLGAYSLLHESSIVDNGTTGVTGSGFATIRNSSITGNGSTGIDTGSYGNISDNVVSQNGGTGISCGNGCLVRANSIASNGDTGLSLSSRSGYRNNVINDHATQPVDGGIYMAPNACDGFVSPLSCDPP